VTEIEKARSDEAAAEGVAERIRILKRAGCEGVSRRRPG
jgi:hypothetical protein